MSRTLRLSFVLLFIAGGLAACGKRGHLDPPPSQKQASGESASSAPGAKTDEAKGDQAGSGETRLGGRKRSPITAPKRDLIFDRLLD